LTSWTVILQQQLEKYYEQEIDKCKEETSQEYPENEGKASSFAGKGKTKACVAFP